MTPFTTVDYRHMARALQLARRGLYSTQPNPRVGCILASGAEQIAEGWHQRAGEAHAEIAALAVAGKRARGSVAYVTLEPCAHHGRTGPCAEALIAAGVSRVVAAMPDPNPQVAGAGFDKLRAAGISVEVGLLQAAARKLNQGFLSRFERGRPFVRLKLATSLDGATAMLNGESQWITSAAARRDVQRLRAEAGAVLSGIGTVAADDPSFTVRDERFGNRQPLRAIVDSSLSISVTAKLLREPGATVLYCVDNSNASSLAASNVDIVKIAAEDDWVSLGAVLEDLAQREINDVLVEAGPTLAGSLLTANLVDELVIYQAPHIMGSESRSLAVTPEWTQLANRLGLHVVDRRAVGCDWRLTAVPGDANSTS